MSLIVSFPCEKLTASLANGAPGSESAISASLLNTVCTKPNAPPYCTSSDVRVGAVFESAFAPPTTRRMGSF